MEFDRQVQLPVDHFRKAAKREYVYWRRALVREFYQNSVDAHATEIRFNVEETPEHYILTVIDNGKGMSEEDCESKLLTMGGTDKGNESVGGFGVAKQILYFAWPRWEILSRNYKVTGSGGRYKIEPHSYTHGVTSVVYLEKDESFNEGHIRGYLTHCDARVKTLVNGEEFTKWYTSDKAIKTLSFATLYKNEGDPDNTVNVRVRGVNMFFAYVAGLNKHRLTLELHGNAREILTCNRDGLNDPYRTELEKLLRDIAINPKQSLRDNTGVITRTYEGTGPTAVLTDEFVEKAVAIIEKARNNLGNLSFHKKAEVPNIFDKEEEKEEKSEPIETFVPTILVRFHGNKGIPRKYDPIMKNGKHVWNQKTEKMLALWQRMIRQILIDNKVSCIYGIGMTFENEVEAKVIYEAGIPFFLINPEIWQNPLNLSGKARWLILQEMKQRALHEIAHFAFNTEDHNEDFIGMIGLLEANTWRNEKAYRELEKLKKIDFL